MQVLTSQHFRGRRAALIIGHPGHELRVWGWMRAARPIVAVVTDGGGHARTSRLHLTRALCAAAAAPVSAWFGVTTDEATYHAILSHDADFFLRMADDFGRMLREHRVDCVAGDAIEGYNPTHDLCRHVIDRAVRLAAPVDAIDNYAFLLEGNPLSTASRSDCVRLELDPTELALKVAAGRDYATAVGGTLLGEVEQMLAAYGETAFAQEYLIPVDAWASGANEPSGPPFYETYRERQVAAGHYQHVIRLREHVTPIVERLRNA